MEEKKYKYYAFISYNSKDKAWGEKVQRKLEGYRIPSTLCSEHGWKKNPIKPVFFAPTDIQPGELREELQQRLRDSRHLIVICSPNSAKSEWVGREIEFFHSLGRPQNIHFFIVEGTPHNANPKLRCYNPVVVKLGLDGVLGANVNEKVSSWSWVNKERAYIQLITKLLGIEFDDLWQRHKRLLLQKALYYIIALIVAICAIFAAWAHNKTTEVKLNLNEATIHNDNLPQLKDAMVTLNLSNEIKTDTIDNWNDYALFSNIPNTMIGEEVKIHIDCGEDFLPVDTTLTLSKTIVLNIRRNEDRYGFVYFRIWDVEREYAVPNIEVTIEGQTVYSDGDGKVVLHIPIEQQKKEYDVQSSIPLVGKIYMPLTEDSVMEIEK